MLNSLHVKNLALIEEAEVNFGERLNILTGETGAGKSIIIGSINLALGAKADKELIRTGAEYALIELVFSLDNDLQRKKLEEMELPQEDDMVVISRKISAGKSLCRVNGETVTAKQLKELAGVLIDVYGQQEHQSLTNRKKQLELLDDFAGEPLQEIKRGLAELAKAYKELQKEWENSDRDDSLRQKEAELAEFEIAEIQAASLTAGEDEELEQAYRKMANSRKIAEGISLAHQLLAASGADTISEMTGRALRAVKNVEAYDEKLTEMTRQLSEIEGLVYDLGRELADYEESLEYDQEEFFKVEERLNLLNRLKDKYGSSIGEILDYQEKLGEKLERWRHYDAYLEKLQENMDGAREALLAACKKASDLRRKEAAALAGRMKEALRDLNFPDVRFEIQVTAKEERAGENGYDEVKFLLSANPGEPVRALENIASGGELSRIMLGLKTVMAAKDAVGTLIFDEIDAGISGKTAWQVSKKLAALGGGHQIICITHLPQIAAMADTHFKIEKQTLENHASTQIVLLEEEESIAELARLLGGDKLTDAVLTNAKEMKELAADTKQY